MERRGARHPTLTVACRQSGAAPPCRLRSASAPGAEAVKHRRDSIEQLLARLNLAGERVAPRDRHAPCGAGLGSGACGGGQAADAMTTLASMALGEVERNRAERGAKLIAQVTIVAPDASDGGSENLDGVDGEIENVEAWR